MAERGRVLLVGSRVPRGAAIARHLNTEFAVDAANSSALREDGRVERALGYDAVLLDGEALAVPDRARVLEAAVSWLRARDPLQRVIALVPGADVEAAGAAATAGAWDVVFAEAPTEEIAARLRAAASLRPLSGLGGAVEDTDASERQVAPQPLEPMRAADEALALLGSSDKMQRVFALIRRLAATDVPVLIAGESGTGKEMAARAIHERSARARRPFVPINCGAIPETLMESELFGHERGSFTGATRTRPGRIETAHGGTLFLDEIGTLPLALQVKLLRFLEDHQVVHIGGAGPIAVDVRVIAATNQDLAAAVRDGLFREDLYYRIDVFTLELPPLRERGSDAILLARAFLEREAARTGRPLRGFSPEAIAALARSSWPGNVRELINRVQRAVVVAEGPLVTPEDLDLAPGNGAGGPTLREARVEAEIATIRAALRQAGGSRAGAARILGISRTQLYESMSRHGIQDDVPRKKSAEPPSRDP